MMQLSAGRGTRRRERVAAAVLGVGALAAQLLALVVLPAGVASAAPGSLDPNFGTGGSVVTAGDTEATGVAVLSGGDIAVSAGGALGNVAASVFQVNLYDPAGGQVGGWPNSPFGPGQIGSANAVAVLPGDKIVAVGYGYQSTSGTCANQTPEIVEYTSAGTQVFSTATSTACPSGNTVLDAVTYDSVSGDIVAAGTKPTSPPGAVKQSFVEWINPTTGAVAHGPFATGNQTAVAAVAASNGDAVLGGALDSTANLVAFNSTGLDTSFNSGGATPGVRTLSPNPQVMGMAAVPAGASIAAGTMFVTVPASGSSSEIAEVSPTGSVLRTFAAGGWASAVVYQPLGNILTVAGHSGMGSTQNMFLEQFNPSDGTVNSFFGSGGVVTSGTAGSFLNAVATQTDGKVVGAGNGSSVNSVPSVGLVRAYGPSVSIQSPAIVETSVGGPIPGNFTATIDEPLFGAVDAAFCLSGAAGAVNGGGSCNTVHFPANAQSVNVPVTITNVTNPYAETTATLSAQSGNGLAPSLSNGSANFVVRPVASYPGYELVARDGGIFNYGGAPFYGSMGGQHLNAPIVGMASALFGNAGYYLVGSDGGIFTFGSVPYYGSHGGSPLNQPIVGMAIDPATGGYWLVASDGGIFNYNAPYFGSTGGMRLNKPIVGMASTPDGGGYWLVSSDGGIFNFGNAGFLGSHGGSPLNKPIVAMASNPLAQGYWLVASDGGIFNYGSAPFEGSHGSSPLNKPIVGMAAAPNGQGYWLVASDGGIFNYGSAPFEGSHGGTPLNQPIVGMSS